MTASEISPSQDFQQRRLQSISAEDELFKSLQGLQEMNSSQRQQRTIIGGHPTRKSSIGKRPGKEMVDASTGTSNDRRQIRMSMSPKRNNSRSLRNSRTIALDTTLAPPDLERKPSAATERVIRRGHRRASTGMNDNPELIVTTDQEALSPRRNNGSLRGARSIPLDFSTADSSLSPPDLERNTSGNGSRAPHRLGRRASSGVNESTDLMTAEDGAKPSSETKNSGILSPKRNNGSRRGARSIPLDLTAANNTISPPDLERNTSGNCSRAPHRLGRRASSGMNDSPELIADKVSDHPPSSQTKTPETISPTRNNGSRRGARSIPLDFNAADSAQPPSISPKRNNGSRRGSRSLPVDLNTADSPLQPPDLQRKPSEASARIARRGNRRASTGMNGPEMLSPKRNNRSQRKARSFSPSLSDSSDDEEPISLPPSALERNTSGDSDRNPRRRHRRANTETNPLASPVLARRASGGSGRIPRRHKSIDGNTAPPTLESKPSLSPKRVTSRSLRNSRSIPLDFDTTDSTLAPPDLERKPSGESGTRAPHRIGRRASNAVDDSPEFIVTKVNPLPESIAPKRNNGSLRNSRSIAVDSPKRNNGSLRNSRSIAVDFQTAGSVLSPPDLERNRSSPPETSLTGVSSPNPVLVIRSFRRSQVLSNASTKTQSATTINSVKSSPTSPKQTKESTMKVDVIKNASLTDNLSATWAKFDLDDDEDSDIESTASETTGSTKPLSGELSSDPLSEAKKLQDFLHR